MNIANPIYDTVFKYLLNDNKVAKLLLSAIIGEDIVKLDLRPKDIESEIKEKTITVSYIDFVATIRYANGSKKLLIIEIQKAKFATDILRFREYLGEQYINPENVYEVNEPNVTYKKVLPILSIYFLGHKLEHIKSPVIRVQRNYIDATTGKQIKEKEYFIESLTHDSVVIQIPYIKENRKTELLQILSIFDQSNRDRDFHILNVDEETFPAKYQSIIRRLQRAISDTNVRKQMRIEDIYIEDYKNTERLLVSKDKTIEEKDKTIEEKDKTIEKKDRDIEEKDKTIEKKDRDIEEKDKIIEDLKKQLNTKR